MSAETWALSWVQPWDGALDRIERGLDRIEPGLAARDADAPLGAEVTAAAPSSPGWPADVAAVLEPLPALDSDLPEHLADRARALLARTDALAQRVAGELSRTRRELRHLTDRVPTGASPERRAHGHQHPSYLDTRA